MGNDLLQYPNVKEMYERASEILKYDLERMCLEGPRQDLNQTVHCQAAVVVTSLAAVERLRALQPWVKHSLPVTTAATFVLLGTFSSHLQLTTTLLTQNVFYLPNSMRKPSRRIATSPNDMTSRVPHDIMVLGDTMTA